MEKPQFKQNKGRPNKYKFPETSGHSVSLPKKNLLSIRMSAYQFGKRHGLKYRTWTDGNKVIVECVSHKWEKRESFR